MKNLQKVKKIFANFVISYEEYCNSIGSEIINPYWTYLDQCVDSYGNAVLSAYTNCKGL